MAQNRSDKPLPACLPLPWCFDPANIDWTEASPELLAAADAAQAALRQVYPNIEAFYSANEARRRSPEADYGCWWRDDSSHGQPYQISYVQATGEVYAVHIGARADLDAVQVLGVVPPDKDERTRSDLRRELTYYRTLDRILEGWAEHCGRPGGLAWVRERLMQAGEEFRQREVV